MISYQWTGLQTMYGQMYVDIPVFYCLGLLQLMETLLLGHEKDNLLHIYIAQHFRQWCAFPSLVWKNLTGLYYTYGCNVLVSTYFVWVSNYIWPCSVQEKWLKVGLNKCVALTYLKILPRLNSILLKSGRRSGSSSQQFFISMYSCIHT